MAISKTLKFSSISIRNLLSFGEEGADLALQNLNLLIGPNGAGKSNLIEVFGLLNSLPTDITRPFSIAGGIEDWIWKGGKGFHDRQAAIDLVFSTSASQSKLRYHISFRAVQKRPEITDEKVENVSPGHGEEDVYFFYRFQKGHPVVNVQGERRQLVRETLDLNQSVLKQRKDPENYPELTSLGSLLDQISLYRDWSVGIDSAPRDGSPIDSRMDVLDDDAENLATVLNNLMNIPQSKERVLDYLKRFYPPATDLRFNLQGNSLLATVEEWGKFSTSTLRLSDGTLRWLCLLAILLNPNPPSLVCIEEPELGLHPDAINLLGDLLKDAATRTQLIVTTHSEILVNSCSDRPDAVVVCEKTSGSTSFKRLNQETLKDWLDEYSLGELWTKGEIGGNRF